MDAGLSAVSSGQRPGGILRRRVIQLLFFTEGRRDEPEATQIAFHCCVRGISQSRRAAGLRSEWERQTSCFSPRLESSMIFVPEKSLIILDAGPIALQ